MGYALSVPTQFLTKINKNSLKKFLFACHSVTEIESKIKEIINLWVIYLNKTYGLIHDVF